MEEVLLTRAQALLLLPRLWLEKLWPGAVGLLLLLGWRWDWLWAGVISLSAWLLVSVVLGAIQWWGSPTEQLDK